MIETRQSEPSEIAAFADAFRRRSRALKRSFSTVKLEKILERTDGLVRERIDVRLQKRQSPKSLVFSVHFWADRWLWVDIREGGDRGWKFEWTIEGRLSGQKSAVDIVEAITVTDRALFNINGDHADAINAIWREIVIKFSPIIV